MRVVTLDAEDDFDGWRDAVRGLVLDHVPPDQVVWQVGDVAGDLFAGQAESTTPAAGAFSVPRPFIDLARNALLHRDRERFALLHTLLVRLRDQPKLLEDQADPLVRRIEKLAKEVRRDIHKMRAFVRFREVPHQPAPPPDLPYDAAVGGRVGERAGAANQYVAWFEPEHHIVRANAAFFVNRFATMRWSILTPEIAIHWDGKRLSEGPGATKADAPDGDPVEAVWKTYYASIFNPARVKVGAMLKEMPRKYWKNMPETALVPQLIANAQARESVMVATAKAKIGGNIAAAWEALRDEAMACTRCHLYRHATQTVFGEGPVDARLMFVGEQPGDQEDLAGHPFVGPAGQMFDRALAEAGVDRARVYVTNAVKHFKYELRGKRRIHAKPDAGEITACRWWIEQEQAIIKPQVTVALGATAARSLFGRTVTISRERGRALELPDGAGEAWITVHPSYLLRLPDETARREEYARFVEDVRMAAARVD
ncbi:MAG: UdgX family uracil-DNA binding protein [Sphingomonas sp.]|uniref:UdgX family uracil-DNA binding protein n=1 Tax=Sphingomonas sp. TaxID=28214 RepID=UPI001AC3D1B7|nr:UdgX family uracil-DNA binding protein [Sphingomonas sp.]MBN8809002.1 UdgX family uracil-DNA binding protein [Sphingomonas sp.]